MMVVAALGLAKRETRGTAPFIPTQESFSMGHIWEAYCEFDECPVHLSNRLNESRPEPLSLRDFQSIIRSYRERD
jgi:hypothetical protein